MTIKRSYVFSLIMLTIAFGAGFLLNTKAVPENSERRSLNTQIENPDFANRLRSAYTASESNDVIYEIQSQLAGMEEAIRQNNLLNDKRLKSLEKTLGKLTETVNDNPTHEDSESDNSMSPQMQFEQEKQNRIEQAIAQTRIMDEALAQEERDEVWAPEMETMILSVSGNESYSGSTFSTPICKSTFCSFEAYHADEQSREKFENIRREIPNSYHIQHFEEPGGVIRSVMYLIKQGEEPKSVVFNTLNNNQ